MTAALQFDQVGHKYSLAGRPMPSVTQVLDGLSLTPPYPEDRGQKALGTAIRRACELAVWGRLDLDRTSPELIPYVTGFLEKVREMRIRPLKTELRVWHAPEGYAGTIDLWALIFDGEQAVIDLKSGAPPACVALQTAGYAGALTWMGGSGLLGGLQVKAPRRFSMQLTPGRAVVRECSNTYDHGAWTGAVRLYRWLNENTSR